MFTVVVPFYNRSRFLRRLLNSISIQCIENLEVFIVDNGSFEEEAGAAWDIINDFDSSLDVCYVSTLKTGNANYARNLGCEFSSKKYIAYLDSDDYWPDGYLNSVLEIINSGESRPIYSGAKVIRDETECFYESRQIGENESPVEFLLGKNRALAQTSSYILPASILRGRRLWDEGLKRHQDYDFFIKVFDEFGWRYNANSYVILDWAGNSKRLIDFSSIFNFYYRYKSRFSLGTRRRYLLLIAKEISIRGGGDEWLDVVAEELRIAGFLSWVFSLFVKRQLIKLSWLLLCHIRGKRES